MLIGNFGGALQIVDAALMVGFVREAFDAVTGENNDAGTLQLFGDRHELCKVGEKFLLRLRIGNAGPDASHCIHNNSQRAQFCRGATEVVG